LDLLELVLDSELVMLDSVDLQPAELAFLALRMADLALDQDLDQLTVVVCLVDNTQRALAADFLLASKN
jgi:hypothetical protein